MDTLLSPAFRRKVNPVVTFCTAAYLFKRRGSIRVTASELNSSSSPTRWPCPSFEVDCAPQVLHAVCTEAVEAFRKLAKGGLEIGGILLGRRAGRAIAVLAARPILCEHRQGPSFVL